MRRLLLTLSLLTAFALASSPPVRAQVSTGNLTTTAANCGNPPANSTGARYANVGSAGGAAITLVYGSGASGTVSFFGSGNGGATWDAITSLNNSNVSTATGNGTWQFNPTAYGQICAAFTTASAGTVTVTIRLSPNSAGHGGGGSGGGGGISSVSCVSGCTVANPTTAPAITVTSAGTVTSVSGTANQIASTGGTDPILSIVTNPTLPGNTTGTFIGNLTGNVTGNASGTAGSFTGNLTGDATSVGMATTVVKLNGTSLAGLATGIVKNTTGTGVPSIAVAGDFPTLNQNTTGSAAKWTTARNLAGNSVDGSANVAFANKFVVQGTTDAGLSGAQFLGALATGILKNTTTTGVLSAAASSDVYGLWSGTCNNTTFLRGDGACATPSSSGNTTSTSLTTGFVPKASGANAIVNSLCDDSITTASTFTCAEAITSTGAITSGSAGGVAGAVIFPQGTANGHAGTTQITVEAPASVTSYEIVLPGTSATGVVERTNSAAVSTESVVATTGTGSVVQATSPTLVTPVLGTPTSVTLTNGTGLPGAGIVSASVTATQLAAQYSKGSCTEVWSGSGTSFALTSGDDAASNNSCYNDSGVTRTITAVKCRNDNSSNTTTVNPTFGSAGTGTTILSGALTCGNSYAYSSTGTVSNASWTTGTGIDPAMSGTLTGTSIAMIVEYTF